MSANYPSECRRKLYSYNITRLCNRGFSKLCEGSGIEDSPRRKAKVLRQLQLEQNIASLVMLNETAKSRYSVRFIIISVDVRFPRSRE